MSLQICQNSSFDINVPEFYFELYNLHCKCVKIASSNYDTTFSLVYKHDHREMIACRYSRRLPTLQLSQRRSVYSMGRRSDHVHRMPDRLHGPQMRPMLGRVLRRSYRTLRSVYAVPTVRVQPEHRHQRHR